jgi:succinyl-CoA synthetase alpha subunit
MDTIQTFGEDKDTEALVLIGEIGGDAEERAADWIKDNLSIPVVAFIAGRTAPPGKRMGHAGAIVSGGTGTAAEKKQVLEAMGIPVADRPVDIVPKLKEIWK